MQLRYLSTLQDIAGERSSTVVFPIPVDFLRTVAGAYSRDNAVNPVAPAAASGS